MTTTDNWQERLNSQAQSFGMQEEFNEAITAGNMRFLNVLGMVEEELPLLANVEEGGGESYDRLEKSIANAVNQLDEAFQMTNRTRRGPHVYRFHSPADHPR